MYLPCDECGESVSIKDMIPESYIQGDRHLGVVKEWMLCKDCANERAWWKKQYGLDADGNPGL
jgi:hypothetical protein